MDFVTTPSVWKVDVAEEGTGRLITAYLGIQIMWSFHTVPYPMCVNLSYLFLMLLYVFNKVDKMCDVRILIYEFFYIMTSGIAYLEATILSR